MGRWLACAVLACVLARPEQGGPLPASGPTGIPAPSRRTTSITFGWMLRPAKPRGVFTGSRYEAGAGPGAACRLAPRSIDCRPL